jgi:hypothetical protein
MASGVRSSLAVLAAAAGMLLAPAAAAAPTSDHGLSVAGKHCGKIGFTSGTDDVAAGIRAKHVGCHTVRRHIRRMHVRGVEPEGFDCRRRVHLEILGHMDHRCESGDRRFSWQKF